METAVANVLSQPQMLPFVKIPPWILIILLILSIVWKGLALWKAARLSSKGWFILLLVINTFGILEIIYIYVVAKKYIVEVEESG